MCNLLAEAVEKYTFSHLTRYFAVVKFDINTSRLNKLHMARHSTLFNNAKGEQNAHSHAVCGQKRRKVTRPTESLKKKS